MLGSDRATKAQHIYVAEGPLDSVLIDNCIPLAGPDFTRPLSVEGRLMQNGEVTMIWDNEPRNKEICKQMENSLNGGRGLVIWPDSIKHKDINDMIVAGYSQSQVQQIIKDNTFIGVAARLRFAEWRKINV
jgi:hypothetical protein